MQQFCVGALLVSHSLSQLLRRYFALGVAEWIVYAAISLALLFYRRTLSDYLFGMNLDHPIGWFDDCLVYVPVFIVPLELSRSSMQKKWLRCFLIVILCTSSLGFLVFCVVNG